MGPVPGDAALEPAPLAPPQPQPDRLGGYRSLQVVSIALVLGGVGLLVMAGVLRAGKPDTELTPDLAISLLLMIAGGGLSIVVGLLMNAVRAIVVRETLPAARYRGPAIFVLLALAIIFSVIASIAAAGDVVALLEGGSLSVAGSLLLLTVTQMGLVMATILFVAVPKALPGVHLLPERGAWRSVLIGIGVAIPAWVAATLLGRLLQLLLEMLDRAPDPGITGAALARVDPTVLVLAIVLIAPVAEEIFFRGVVVNAWLREYGPRVAIIGSAALFAAIHTDTRGADEAIGSLATVIPIFGLGLTLAVVYLRTGSLLAPIALHATFNGISVTLALLQRLLGLNLPV